MAEGNGKGNPLGIVLNRISSLVMAPFNRASNDNGANGSNNNGTNGNGSQQKVFPGAKGIQITAKDITSSVDGTNGQLYYGRYTIAQMATLPYEAVLYYLTKKEFPSNQQFTDYLEELRGKSGIDSINPLALTIINGWDLKTNSSMEILQAAAAVSGLSFDDPETAFVQFPLLVGLINQRLEGRNPVTLSKFPQDRPYSISEHQVRTLLEGKNLSEEDIIKCSKILNLSNIVHLIHGVGNASTIGAKVAAGTKAGLASILSTATGILSGEAHGGANEAALKNLGELLEFVNQDQDRIMILDNGDLAAGVTEAELDQKVAEFIQGKIDRKDKIPGLGHAEYKLPDPRAALIKAALDALAHKSPFYTAAASLQRVASENQKFKERGIYPNVDFYTGILLKEVLGLNEKIMTALFAGSRSAGWFLGALAQFGTLIRPGEDQEWLETLRETAHQAVLPGFTQDYANSNVIALQGQRTAA
jgi:citrate synthase